VSLLNVDESRPNPEETRQRLLDAGLALLEQQASGNVMSHIKAPVVSARAGLTPGAFYYHWPKQELFVRDLLEYCLNVDRTRPAIDKFYERLREPVRDLDDLEQTYRAAVVENLDLTANSSRFAVQMAIWTRQSHDAHIHELLRTLYAGYESRLARVYEQGFKSAGLEPRPPFTLGAITAILTAFLEGAAVRHSIDAEMLPADVYGEAVIVLLRELLQPVGAVPAGT
jgi:AcrR family transcriptional regulator